VVTAHRLRFDCWATHDVLRGIDVMAVVTTVWRINSSKSRDVVESLSNRSQIRGQIEVLFISTPRLVSLYIIFKLHREYNYRE